MIFSNVKYKAIFTEHPYSSYGAGWTPVKLSPEFFADASNVASITKDVSDFVSQWNDLSGNDNHLVQATGANQPVYNADGYITGDGTSDFMRALTGLDGSGDFTMSFWYKSTNVHTDREHPFGVGPYTSGVYQPLQVSFDFNETGTGMWFFWNSGGSPRIEIGTAGDFTDTNWRHFMAIRSGSTIEIYVNNVSQGSSTSGTSFTLDPNIVVLSVNILNGAFHAEGSIQMPFYADKALTSDERALLYDYKRSSLGYNTSSEAFFTAASITDTATKDAIDEYVVGLQSNGIWDKIHAIYPYVGGTASSHSYNLKDTSAYQITWYNSITHDANGVKGDGSTGYGMTGITPSTHLDLNSTSLLAWVNQTGTGIDMGCYTSPQFFHLATEVSGNVRGYFFNNDPVLGSITDELGLSASVREDSSTARVYNKGVLVNSELANASVSLPTQELAVLARFSAVASNFSDRRYGMQMISDGLTESEITTLNTLTSTLQTALGR